MNRTDFLIIGAGPYSISAAAYAQHLGVETTVVGKPLESWKTHMPRGMFLRSGPDWHLDARDVNTFEAYLRVRGLTHAEVKPVPLDVFLDYVSWFMGQSDVRARSALVTRLEKSNGSYTASLDDGTQIQARQVLLGLGFALFKHVPPELAEILPPGSYVHTCDTVDFEFYRGRRVLIVGGRQSAFEWAALMNEKGAQEIHLTHRHATPRFEEPNWDWVQPMVRRTLTDHAWWRNLPAEEQETIRHEFWAVGRLTLEAWLDARVHQPNIHIHEKTAIAQVTPRGDRTYNILLDDGARFNVDHIILATGYRPDIRRVPFLDRATILDRLATNEGYPALDTVFQTNLPNLYVTGFSATRDFGPFFGFTVACPVAARIIGEAVAGQE
jgi:cation diffusion facilitator CzcD-associated flavoprotein CzcO